MKQDAMQTLPPRPWNNSGISQKLAMQQKIGAHAELTHDQKMTVIKKAAKLAARKS